jgi:hypothetical protein
LRGTGCPWASERRKQELAGTIRAKTIGEAPFEIVSQARREPKKSLARRQGRICCRRGSHSGSFQRQRLPGLVKSAVRPILDVVDHLIQEQTRSSVGVASPLSVDLLDGLRETLVHLAQGLVEFCAFAG